LCGLFLTTMITYAQWHTHILNIQAELLPEKLLIVVRATNCSIIRHYHPSQVGKTSILHYSVRCCVWPGWHSRHPTSGDKKKSGLGSTIKFIISEHLFWFFVLVDPKLCWIWFCLVWIVFPFVLCTETFKLVVAILLLTCQFFFCRNSDRL